MVSIRDDTSPTLVCTCFFYDTKYKTISYFSKFKLRPKPFPHRFWSSYKYLTHKQSESVSSSMTIWVLPIMLTIEP